MVRASSSAITLEGKHLWILVLGQWDHKSLYKQLQYFGGRTKCAVGQQKGVHEHWVWVNVGNAVVSHLYLMSRDILKVR